MGPANKGERTPFFFSISPGAVKKLWILFFFQHLHKKIHKNIFFHHHTQTFNLFFFYFLVWIISSGCKRPGTKNENKNASKLGSC